MERLSMDEAFERIDDIREALESDACIIFPTDTIYGIGCKADSEKALLALRKLKDRWGKPYSIIAPGKDWIRERFDIEGRQDRLDKLPGPFTFVLTPREAFSRQLSSSGSVGVRIPDHPVSRFVEALGFPIVATSVNQAGLDPMTSPDQFSDERYARFEAAAFVIEDGVHEGPASTVIDLTGDRPVYVRM